MADEKPAVQATKAVAVGSILPLLASTLPQPYDHYLMWACVAMAATGWAATQIEIPKDDKSKWRFVYEILQILASNYGKALNAAVYLKGSRK